MSDNIENDGTPVRPWDLFQKKNLVTNVVPKEVGKKIAKDRLKICTRCPEFNHVTKQCKICHCVMPLKVKLAAAYCPLDPPKWGAVTVENVQ